MQTVRDRLWIWGHVAGSHEWVPNMIKGSKITPIDAAEYLGVPNMVMVVFLNKPEPPFDEAMKPLAGLKQVVWSIVGDSSSNRNDKKPDLDEVIRLAKSNPNITGAIMDDFFLPNSESESKTISRWKPEDIAEFRDELHDSAQPLDLWVVLYKHDMHLPVQEYLSNCDTVTFWTWYSKELPDLEANFEKAEKLIGDRKKILGCYLWDYGDCKPMPVELMQHQCELGLKWLKEGRIDGMIFLASCICDLGYESIEWTKNWIAEVGDQTL